MFNPSRLKSGLPNEPGATKKFHRFLLRAVLGVLCIIGIVAAILAYRIHSNNAASANHRLPLAPPPQSSTSILIFSPHPDDETLGTSGLVQQTLLAGGKVHVVFMTNGDAFRVGVSDYYKVLPVKPSDCVRYGEMRQHEALAALAESGLSPTNVTFLGYSDRGLMRMWENWWLPTNPWTSYYTHASTVVYPNAPSHGTPNCGVSVLADVCKQILKCHPTDIYTTHPTDDHPDHSASATFVVAAMHVLEASGDSWVSHVHLHFFLIHRGDWPVPQGLNPTLTLAPPGAFLGLDTVWNTLPLAPYQTKAKGDAINKYLSQDEMMGDFLHSFVRANELFGELPESGSIASTVTNNTVHLDGTPKSWPTDKPVAMDPTGDTVIRDFQAGGDITAIYAATDSNTIYLRMDTHGNLSREINYRFMIRPFDKRMRTIPKVLILSFSPRTVPANTRDRLIGGATIIWHDNCIEATLPKAKVGIVNPTILFVEGKTTFTDVIVDHTGYRTVILHN